MDSAWYYQAEKKQDEKDLKLFIKWWTLGIPVDAQTGDFDANSNVLYTVEFRTWHHCHDESEIPETLEGTFSFGLEEDGFHSAIHSPSVKGYAPYEYAYSSMKCTGIPQPTLTARGAVWQEPPWGNKPLYALSSEDLQNLTPKTYFHRIAKVELPIQEYLIKTKIEDVEKEHQIRKRGMKSRKKKTEYDDDF